MTPEQTQYQYLPVIVTSTGVTEVYKIDKDKYASAEDAVDAARAYNIIYTGGKGKPACLIIPTI